MKSIRERAAAIRLLILDVDGVLTSGIIYYANNNIDSGVPAEKRGNSFLNFMLRKSKAFACTKGENRDSPPLQPPSRKVSAGTAGIEFKGFHLHDGLGIKLLQKTGVAVAIISGKHSEGVLRRIQELNIEHFYLGQDEKLPAYEELKQKLHLADHQIAYMGDDLPDLPLLRRAGLAITVSEAPKIIHDHVHYVTTKKAGKGAVREVCELLMEAQDQYQSVLQSYLI